jgi:hypothetical protein
MMLTAILLVSTGVALRLVPHAPGLVPLCAIALYAGARLPRRWAILIPLAIMVISDLLLDRAHGYPFYSASRVTSYAFFMGMAFWSSFVRKEASPMTRGGMSIAASTLFFLVSNFAVWAEGTGYHFPLTFPGLMSTYTVALPMYRNMLTADLIGTAVFFLAVTALVAHLAEKKTAVSETLA